MIQVEHLTKKYGDVTAIEDLSFSVEKGQILGFLGPNGAGKTTTMRILTGFLPATSGTSRVAGFDVETADREVKRRIGYLPETPPLYPDMTVDTFLKFAATIKGVDSVSIPSRLGHVKERCGLEEWGGRLIKHLSKGYRQRVGLAQALIHDPPVLILDEPTAGLDPKQIIEVRELIRSLGGDHTIVLSTHILPEVGMTCERVIIIKEGRIVAEDTPERLTGQLKGGNRIRVHLRGDPASVIQEIEALEGVRNACVEPSPDGSSQIIVEASGDSDPRSQLAQVVISAGLELLQLQRETMSLEEIFLEVTTDDPVTSIPEGLDSGGDGR